jgi:uncharacterized protein DUF547
MRRLAFLGLFGVVAWSCSTPPPEEPGPVPTASTRALDHSAWDRVLRRHVRRVTIRGIELNGVDYEALRRGDPDDDAYLKQLAETDLSGLGRDELLALWINAYNALCIHVVLQHWPLQSIRDAGGRIFGKVWDLPAGVVAGRERTLDEIEHHILRPLHDPRIHAAIVCASVSCPDLRPEAFVAARLGQQLDEQVALWLANPGKGLRLERDAKRVTLSPIFQWFAEDFGPDGALGFVSPRAPSEARPFLEQHGGELAVGFFDYDWGLNTASAP